MSTRTLSPAALRRPAPRRHASRVLVVVPDGLPGATGSDDAAVPDWVPEWAAQWCGRSGWELRCHPETGPFAAAAAARLDARVLILRPAEPAAPERSDPHRTPCVVAAVRSLPDDAPVVADAAACAARMGARLTIVHAVPRSFAERSVGLAGAVTHGQRLLDAAAGRAAAHEPGLRVECQLLRVRPYELVGEALHADLLVVGGARTDRTAGEPGSGPGLVAHSALHHAPCPVLLTPR
jgi:nucleotide-binding universal stress UspA family protein